MKKPGIVLGLLAFAVGVFVAIQFAGNSTGSTRFSSGTVVPVAEGKFGGDFTLKQGDKPVKLSDFKGKVVVMYFGYASCPDVCPTTLGIIGSALKELSPEEIAQVQPIFISVDPERDSGEKLMAYAQHFSPAFIGITGTQEDLQKVAGQYGAFYAKTQSDSAMGYLVDHTSKTYLVSKDGAFVKILPHDMSKEDVVTSLREAL